MTLSMVQADITTDAGGNAIAYTPKCRGYLHLIRYVPDGGTPLATGADLTITEENTGLPLFAKVDIGTVAVQWLPRTPTHAAADGTALLYAAGGTAQSDRLAIADSRIKVVCAQGGNVLKGAVQFWVDDAD